MKYLIKENGKIIAKFMAEHDRDICLNRLCEEHDDAKFEKEDI